MIPTQAQLAQYLYEIAQLGKDGREYVEFHELANESQQIWKERALALIKKIWGGDARIGYGCFNPQTGQGIYKLFCPSEEALPQAELIAFNTEWEEFSLLMSELEASLKVHKANPYINSHHSKFYNQRQVIKAAKRMVDEYYRELYCLGQMMIEYLRSVCLVLQTQYTDAVTHRHKMMILDKVVFPLIEGGIKKIKSIQEKGIKAYAWEESPKDIWKAPYPIEYLRQQIKDLKEQLGRQSLELKDDELDNYVPF
ncbi:hypothetical protein [Gloeothece verrucosa]|uniref:Uncharacterized protein n=1 Tax=Gloeothece verrucosa (strain PCC 7822) TaxID=497965 RepID=E0UCC2_GLOV7|nr:hypothetical protein [Gloeothece verrucosa]ADN12879.1 hypothetical protein Cyan7822_0859 [Gloeothece verrucosa PCC 7822]